MMEAESLLAMMRDPHRPARERVAVGRQLAESGDPRPDVMTIEGMEFCWVPPGRFWMGGPGHDKMAWEEEYPDGWIEVPYGYWMGKYPVTTAQFAPFVESGGYLEERWWGLAKAAGRWTSAGIQGEGLGVASVPCRIAPAPYELPFGLPSYPVVGVTWYEALAYIEWLMERLVPFLPAGWRMALPNEPEWEKAARGGEVIPQTPLIHVLNRLDVSPDNLALMTNPNPTRLYAWGDKPDPRYGNFSLYVGATTPDQLDELVDVPNAVGCYGEGASPYGCEEMNGNIWEWTRSAWGFRAFGNDFGYPYNPHDGREALSALDFMHRVLRGGDFATYPWGIRCAFRGTTQPFIQRGTFGFRLVIVPPMPELV